MGEAARLPAADPHVVARYVLDGGRDPGVARRADPDQSQDNPFRWGPQVSGAPKAKGRLQPAFSQSSKNANCGSRAINVSQVDGPVNNCVQHLLILNGPTTVAERFITDSRIEQARQPAPMLGYAHWTGIGRPFATWTSREGSLVAWCEAPLPRRTARKNCMAATVQRLAEVCATSEVLQ